MEKRSHCYAGIGSRKTPQDILVLMVQVAEKLADEGWILRSGHALGADRAFERGAGQNAEIYLPWPGFEGQMPIIADYKLDRPTTAALALAAEIHPAWAACKPAARKLHARNMHQILGPNLDNPVDFVICWTDGTGGTTQALRLAEQRDIPITNLFDQTTREQTESWLAEPW